MNITSPSFSLEQTNFILEDWGTNPSDSSIEFSFRTYSVAMEPNGSGCGCRLELMFPRLPFSSYPTSGSLTWDSSSCLGWIVMALIKLWIWVEHCGSIVGTVVKGMVEIESLGWNRLGVTKIVLLRLKSIPLTSRLIDTRGCVVNKGLFRIFHAILSVVKATADLT
ncbi:hypothetical protein Tco_1432838 [Tanacetum coccineum]